MKLEILSLSQAVKYIPKDKTGVIRIFNSFTNFPPELIKSPNWAEIKTYSFDDVWPRDWKEYERYPKEIMTEELKEIRKLYPKMTEKSLLELLEIKGQLDVRQTCFTKEHAKKILTDYEKYWQSVDTLMIHCLKGQNRSPAIGIAMNDIYGWGIKGLEEQFPNYRRYIHHTMMEASK